ncbi:hypothetical protein TNCV_2391351 [Trichonephila clavipes]|nr:hypothetical protein TNCV_2391351 [Trichonephila clavipes]
MYQNQLSIKSVEAQKSHNNLVWQFEEGGGSVSLSLDLDSKLRGSSPRAASKCAVNEQPIVQFRNHRWSGLTSGRQSILRLQWNNKSFPSSS